MNTAGKGYAEHIILGPDKDANGFEKNDPLNG